MYLELELEHLQFLVSTDRNVCGPVIVMWIKSQVSCMYLYNVHFLQCSPIVIQCKIPSARCPNHEQHALHPLGIAINNLVLVDHISLTITYSSLNWAVKDCDWLACPDAEFLAQGQFESNEFNNQCAGIN